jgi:hypothetical protein
MKNRITIQDGEECELTFVWDEVEEVFSVIDGVNGNGVLLRICVDDATELIRFFNRGVVRA